MQTVLKVENLQIELVSKKENVKPVHQVNFEIKAGETLALVGESGSGKSMTAHAIMGLIQSWNSRLKPNISGSIIFTDKKGKQHHLNEMNDKEYDQIRGKNLSIIFQEPFTALNPVVSIGKQLVEVIVTHKKISQQEAIKQVIQLLEKVGIPEPEARMSNFPHQFSGGQIQRIMIAMAIACEPSCLIADEPTTALDVTIQKQILDLLKSIQKEQNMAILLITHDLGVVSNFADKVAVMYAGHIVEYGSVKQIFNKPEHPYTKLLLQSIPTLETEPGVPLLTKRDLMSEEGREVGELIFNPNNVDNYSLVHIAEGHYATKSFTKEIGK